MKEPKILPCGYTACFNCLKQLQRDILNKEIEIKTFLCPIKLCSKEHSMKYFESKLIPNGYLIDLLYQNIDFIATDIITRKKMTLKIVDGNLCFNVTLISQFELIQKLFILFYRNKEI
jgi:hypothetical protein